MLASASEGCRVVASGRSNGHIWLGHDPNLDETHHAGQAGTRAPRGCVQACGTTSTLLPASTHHATLSTRRDVHGVPSSLWRLVILRILSLSGGDTFGLACTNLD